MLPLALAPRWMRAIADWNPLSYVVNAQRSMFAGHFGGNTLWEAAAITGALTAAALYWAARSFARGLS
jgi:ABC-2 type transport system permease protein